MGKIEKQSYKQHKKDFIMAYDIIKSGTTTQQSTATIQDVKTKKWI